MKNGLLTSIMVAVLAGAWCIALWVARWSVGASSAYFFLNFNLFLAAIPVALSSCLPYVRSTTGSVALGAVWLVFFPNAPYLLTDLIHLRPRTEAAPFWFDWLMLVSFAVTGLLYACISLSQVHRCLKSKLPDWRCEAAILGLLGLTGFGIYLGRFARWNSWDILTRPEMLLAHVGEKLINAHNEPRMLAYSFGLTVILGLAYFGPLIIFRALHADLFTARNEGSRLASMPPQARRE